MINVDGSTYSLPPSLARFSLSSSGTGWDKPAMIGKNRIMIYGPKDDGTYVVEFMTAEGDVLAISIPRTEAHVIRHFQERMPYGLFVPDVAVE
jgi:hypothetical protein